MAKVVLSGPQGKEKVELLVDTGSLYTWVSETLLNKMGVKPTSRRRFRTIEGKTLDRPVGEAIIEYDGEKAHCVVVFAEPRDASVMGVTALENLGLEIDPTRQTIRRSESLAAY